MKDYSKYNAENVLENVNKCIEEIERAVEFNDYDYRRIVRVGMRRTGGCGSWKYKSTYAFYISAVYDELSIFDWWNDKLSLSQLKQMKAFLQTAIKLGYKGYVCFKVGATGCSHGMWASQKESTDGYSPKNDEEVLFHSFRSGDNHWGVCHKGIWDEYDEKRSLADVKKIINDECQSRWVVRK